MRNRDYGPPLFPFLYAYSTRASIRERTVVSVVTVAVASAAVVASAAIASPVKRTLVLWWIDFMRSTSGDDQELTIETCAHKQ